LNNPSNISFDAVDIALPVYYRKAMIGRAAFNVLAPGEDSMPAEFHYEPANPNDTVAEVCVANFILN
jgi:hypothetical protein